jgi:protoporphyrinogen oxidase
MSAIDSAKRGRVGVIGAGPAGLTAGYLLQKEGFNVTVFESTDKPGGLSRTIELWGQKVDLGPHRFFSNDRRINEFWLEINENDYVMVDRLTRIFYKNKFFHYPLKPLNALSNLGIIESCLCVLSYMAARVKFGLFPIRRETFEQWVVSRFGRRLFNIFFKSYSEKLWGISCKELDADFARQRIKKLSLFGAIWNAVTGGKGNRHKTLIDQFAYPSMGSGSTYEKMANKLTQMGGDIIYNQKVRQVGKCGNEAKSIVCDDGSCHEFDWIISTMPLTRLVEAMDDCPQDVLVASKGLKFRNTILVYLEINSQNIFPDNWIYIHSENLCCGRITNFRNWCECMLSNRGSSILCLEYWANDNDELWKASNDYLINLAKSEIVSSGLAMEASIINGEVVRIPKSYPIYKVGYKENLGVVSDYLKNISNLLVIGRYGSFKYNNQDHSILMGLLACDNISKNKKNDLWSLNSDDEYQESALITSTGLAQDKK